MRRADLACLHCCVQIGALLCLTAGKLGVALRYPPGMLKATPGTRPHGEVVQNPLYRSARATADASADADPLGEMADMAAGYVFVLFFFFFFFFSLSSFTSPPLPLPPSSSPLFLQPPPRCRVPGAGCSVPCAVVPCAVPQLMLLTVKGA